MNIGVLGDGQLALLMAKAFNDLQSAGIIDAKHEVWILSPIGDACPAKQYGAKIYRGDCKNAADVAAFIKNAQIERLTAEMTHFDLTAIEAASNGNTQLLYPSINTFKIIQNKHAQKQHLHENEVPLAAFMEIEQAGVDAIEPTALQKLGGYPLMLKTSGPARDGAGVIRINNASEYAAAIKKFGPEAKLYVEKYIEKSKELSVIVTVGVHDQFIVYPTTEVIPKDNTCYITETPANINPTLSMQAQDLALKAVQSFSGAGTYVVDLFLTKDDTLCVNGVTPRLDNACQYTDACSTSAYVNHVLAILDLTLKSANLSMHVITQNILGKASGEEGQKMVDEQKALAITLGGEAFDFGKEAKPNRKLGFVLFKHMLLPECRAKFQQYDQDGYSMLPEFSGAAFAPVHTAKSSQSPKISDIGKTGELTRTGSGIISSPNKPYTRKHFKVPSLDMT